MLYAEYLKSEHWQQTRERVLTFWDHSCVLCGSRTNLEVHHRSYAHVGQERLNELIVLCDTCHERHHFAGRAYAVEPIAQVLERVSAKIMIGA